MTLREFLQQTWGVDLDAPLYLADGAPVVLVIQQANDHTGQHIIVTDEVQALEEEQA